MNKKDDTMTDQEFIEKSEALLNSDNGHTKPIVNLEPSGPTRTSVSKEQMKQILLNATLTDKKTYQEPSKWISAFNEFHKVT